MSVEAKGVISADASRFKQASKQVQEEFQKIGTQSFRSMGIVQKETTKSSNAIGSFGSKVPQVRNALGNLANQADQTGNSMHGLGEKTKNAERSTTALAVSVLGLGQSIGGLSDSVFGFQEKIVALEKSQFGLKETTEDLKRAEEDYREALEKGFESVRDQERAEKDLLLLREKLKIETKEVKAEQEALNSEFVNFGLTVSQTAIFTLIALNQILSTTQKQMIAAKLQAISLSGAMKFMGFNATAAAAQFKLVSLSLVGLQAGIRGVWLALGPIGLAIIGVTAAWAAWESNIFGVQQKMQDLWDLLKKFMPVLSGLEILVDNIFPEANADLGEFDRAINTANTSTLEFNETLGLTAETGLQGAMIGVSEATKSAVDTIDQFGGLMFDVHGNLVDMTRGFEKQKSVLFQWQDALRGAKTEVIGLNNELKKNDLELNADKLTRVKPEKAKELSDFDKILQANKGIAIIRLLLEQAAFQAEIGNIRGAVFLEKQAQLIGRNVSSIAGTSNLINLGFNKFSNLGKNVLENSRIPEQLFRGPTSSFSESGSVAGLVSGLSPSLGSNVTGLTRSSARRRRGHSKFRSDTVGGTAKKLVEMTKRAHPNLFTRSGVNIGSNVAGVLSRFTTRGGNLGRVKFSRRRGLIQNAVRNEVNRSRSEAFARIRMAEMLAGFTPEFDTADDFLSLSTEEISRRIREETSLQRGFIDSGLFEGEEIASLRSSYQGRVDIANIERFRRRELASAGVVT